MQVYKIMLEQYYYYKFLNIKFLFLAPPLQFLRLWFMWLVVC